MARAVFVALEGAKGITPRGRHAAELTGQMRAWLERREGPSVSVGVARAGIATWTRLHGLIDLELQGHFAAMGIDAELLYDDELEALVAAAGDEPLGR